MGIDAYIREQPQILDAVLRTLPPVLADWPPAAPGPVHLVGSGSSMNALVAVEPALRRLVPGPVLVRGPLGFLADLEEGLVREGTAILLSQTGVSTTTIEAAEAAARAGLETIVVTAGAGSPIARLGARTLLMPVGDEPVGPKTKGYTASLAALLLLALRLGGRDLPAASIGNAFAAWTERCREAAAALTRDFGDRRFVMVMAQGRHLGTALEASLKVTEMSGVPAAAFDTEEALHGRLHGLGRDGLALFIAALPAELAMAARASDVLAALGVPSRILDMTGEGAGRHVLDLRWAGELPIPALDLAAAIVPFQWFAWELGRSRGVVPEKMRYPGLSQKLKIKSAKLP